MDFKSHVSCIFKSLFILLSIPHDNTTAGKPLETAGKNTTNTEYFKREGSLS